MAPRLDTERLKATVPEGRLPTTARPTAYTLDMRIDPRQTEFSGTVTLAIDLAEAADGPRLQGNGITVRQAEVAADGLVEAL